jgi:hypothetical protein
MNDSDPPSGTLKELATYLAGRREAILTAWRRAVDADPGLTTASTTTRAQFVDHIPAVLGAFEARLTADLAAERAKAREEEKESAAEHGLHRWQLDVSWWVIRGLERLGLVWNVRVPSTEQLERRRIHTPDKIYGPGLDAR